MRSLAIEAWCLACLSATSLGSGCGNGHARLEDEAAAGTSSVTPEGEILLAPEARGFVRVEVAASSRGVSSLRVPAHIAYRDGTVAEVGTPVAGRVTEIAAHIGEVVQAGQPLLVLRSPDAAAARAELAATQAELDTALAEARRTSEMLARGAGSERERREAELRVAELEIAHSRSRTEVAIVGSGSGGIVTLRAPMAGVVLRRRAAIGMTVGPGDAEPLLEIGDPDALGVTADVFERDVSQVREGAPVEVSFPTSDAPSHGRVAYVAPAVTEGMRTVPVRIELDALPPDARPGLFGRASIGLVDEGISLPSSAVLVRDGDRTIVYVETGEGRFASRDVEVGPSHDGRVYIARGVSVGDRVVVEGALLLDGTADLLL
ncbi:MAG: efflux RND transporter periplasmic adaptor subunit [Sandaracinus sp.]